MLKVLTIVLFMMVSMLGHAATLRTTSRVSVSEDV